MARNNRLLRAVTRSAYEVTAAFEAGIAPSVRFAPNIRRLHGWPSSTVPDPKRTVELLPLTVRFRAMRYIVQRENKLKDSTMAVGSPSHYRFSVLNPASFLARIPADPVSQGKTPSADLNGRCGTLFRSVWKLDSRYPFPGGY